MTAKKQHRYMALKIKRNGRLHIGVFFVQVILTN